MISNTDSTLFIYPKEHMLVKVYKELGARQPSGRLLGVSTFAHSPAVVSWRPWRLGERYMWVAPKVMPRHGQGWRHEDCQRVGRMVSRQEAKEAPAFSLPPGFGHATLAGPKAGRYRTCL